MADDPVDVTPIKNILTPLAVVAAAPARSYRQPSAPSATQYAPLPLALPTELQAPITDVMGQPAGTGYDLGKVVGVLWSAVNQLLARRITSTTGTCVVPAGTVLTAGQTKEVACAWESTPLATPTDALCFLNAGLLGAGKVTAWIKTGSVTATGCVVIFKNTSGSQITAITSALAGLTSITATVIGQALYTPPDADY